MIRFTLAICVITGLAACTPPEPTMTLDEAKQVCQQRISNPTSTSVGVGVSGGSGGTRTGIGLSVGLDLNALADPNGTYVKCVKRLSGQDVTAPDAAQS